MDCKRRAALVGTEPKNRELLSIYLGTRLLSKEHTPGMALPLWKHPSPFTTGFSRRKCEHKALRAQPTCLSAPRAPVLSRWLRLDSSTLDGLTYLHELLTPQTNDGAQKACDVEVVRRNLERLYYLETPHSLVKDGRGCVLLDVSPWSLGRWDDCFARSLLPCQYLQDVGRSCWVRDWFL